MEAEAVLPRAGSRVTIAGKGFEVAPEPADYWRWIAEGRYNHEWRVYDQYLKPEHTFIDLGAWVGAHSLYASTITKDVYALEPDPVAFSILEGNVRNLRIHICQGAIADYKGIITLGSGLLGASTTRANSSSGEGIGAWDENQTVTVDCTTLRDFAGGLLFQGSLFIKSDIEGSEEEIFKDLAFFAERKPVMLIELHPFWWSDERQTWENFQAVKALYKEAFEVPHPNSRTWVLA